MNGMKMKDIIWVFIICLGKKEHEFEPNSPFVKDVKEYKNNETNPH